jgi:hypothetical protein
MTLTPRLTKFVFTSHITFSIGWFGAVAVFLVLAITGLTSQNSQLARSAYLAMELSGWFVIVPFGLASLSTGLIQALGTKWGLFKHYWIIVKLFLTVAATVLLLLHMQPIEYLAGIASETYFSTDQETGLRIQLIADAGAAILLLLATITISVYKPWGLIGPRQKKIKSENITQDKRPINKRTWGFYVIIIGLLVVFIIIHLFGGGMNGH